MTRVLEGLCIQCGEPPAGGDEYAHLCSAKNVALLQRSLRESGLTFVELMGLGRRPRLDLKFLGEVLNATDGHADTFSAGAIAVQIGADYDDVEAALVHLAALGVIQKNATRVNLPAPIRKEGA